MPYRGGRAVDARPRERRDGRQPTRDCSGFLIRHPGWSDNRSFRADARAPPPRTQITLARPRVRPDRAGFARRHSQATRSPRNPVRFTNRCLVDGSGCPWLTKAELLQGAESLAKYARPSGTRRVPTRSGRPGAGRDDGVIDTTSCRGYDVRSGPLAPSATQLMVPGPWSCCGGVHALIVGHGSLGPCASLSPEARLATRA